MNFQNNKITCLTKLDKSKKGSIDKPILNLVNKINKTTKFYTTSSCSGRITILEKKSDKKQDTNWLLVTHKKTNLKEVKQSLSNLSKQDTWFKFEPLILHIVADSIENAQTVVNKARSIGFRRTGIQSTKTKIAIEIASTEIISTIIAKKGKLLIDEDYLKELIKQANKKIIKNKLKIKKFNVLL